MASTYLSVVLAKRPESTIVLGETFRIESQPSPAEKDLADGEVIFQALYLSLDPAMRSWMSDVRSYLPPVPIGGVMRGGALGEIIASKSTAYPVGTNATAMVGWTELAVVKEKDLQKVEVPKNGKLTDAAGVLGITGLTAYFGMLDVGKVKAGDFVVVSGAAGATGSVAAQIAKLQGCTVLGIAGSDDKVQWLRELGLDNALNYKDPNFAEKFNAATEDLIDVFYDNVGGEVLDLALARAKPHARFVMCGGISQLNGNPQGPKNYLSIIRNRIRMEGFMIFDYESRYDEARQALSEWLSTGKIQRRETIIKGGLPAAENALADLWNGVNTGKLLVEVKPPS